MIVVSTTMARYPSRGHVLGYVVSWRFPRALHQPSLGDRCAHRCRRHLQSPFPHSVGARQRPGADLLVQDHDRC